MKATKSAKRHEKSTRNLMPVAAVLLTVSCGSLLGLVRVYDVAPVKASWNGWTHRGDALSQVITCNFDSLNYVELFAGARGNGGAYRAGVWLDGTEIMWSHGDTVPDHGWVRFENWNTRVPSTKGRRYELRFMRSGSDSIQYYYDHTNPYKYGEMPRDIAPAPADLSMRVYGRMKAVDSTWRACTNHGNDPRPPEGPAALSKAKSMGVMWLRDDFECWDTWMGNRPEVMRIYNRYVDGRFNMIGILCYGREVESISSRGADAMFRLSTYPPRNLWANSEQTNYWAQYCRSIMEGLPAVKYWEVFPEANANWYWHDPDIAYYHGSGGVNDTIDAPRERCSLYVRMCRIAESTARALGGEPRRRVIGGGVFRLVDPLDNGASGVDWLRYMFDIAQRNYGAAESCFDIVSVHPYMFYPGGKWRRLHFTESDFRVSLDTARWTMRQAGCPGMELWATEYGWPRWDKKEAFGSLTDTLMLARNVCKFYTSAIAEQADPRGGYDRAIHYELTSRHVAWADNDGFGLLDSLPSQPLLPHGWTFTQLGNVLTGRLCNGRVMDGDTAVDNHARVYEFEALGGARTWVCWKDDDTRPEVGMKLPVRTDRLAGESLAYSGRTPGFSPKVSNDGWLRLKLGERPVFITEIADTSRPDLRVDSVRYEQAERVVRAWVTNHGIRVTPAKSGLRTSYPTRAVLRAEGDSVTQATRTSQIGVNQQVEFSFDISRASLPDTALVSVEVNPGQAYVELGIDDNIGYTLAIKR